MPITPRKPAAAAPRGAIMGTSARGVATRSAAARVSITGTRALNSGRNVPPPRSPLHLPRGRMEDYKKKLEFRRELNVEEAAGRVEILQSQEFHYNIDLAGCKITIDCLVAEDHARLGITENELSERSMLMKQERHVRHVLLEQQAQKRFNGLSSPRAADKLAVSAKLKSELPATQPHVSDFEHTSTTVPSLPHLDARTIGAATKKTRELMRGDRERRKHMIVMLKNALHEMEEEYPVSLGTLNGTEALTAMSPMSPPPSALSLPSKREPSEEDFPDTPTQALINTSFSTDDKVVQQFEQKIKARKAKERRRETKIRESQQKQMEEEVKQRATKEHQDRKAAMKKQLRRLELLEEKQEELDRIEALRLQRMQLLRVDEGVFRGNKSILTRMAENDREMRLSEERSIKEKLNDRHSKFEMNSKVLQRKKSKEIQHFHLPPLEQKKVPNRHVQK